MYKDKLKKTFSSLRVRNYRLYFTGQVISTTGTWMQSIGQAWLVLKLTNSATALGFTVALQFLPILVFGPLGGVVADRFPKRKILYITQTANSLLALTLGLLVYTNSVELWMVYLLALGLGLVNVVDNPTRQTFIPEMVGAEHLMNAVSVNSIQVNLTRVIGPTISAILIATLGLAPLFLFNAVSYIAVIVALAMMNADELYHSPRAEKVRGQLVEGFRYVKSSRIIRTTLIMVAIIGTLTYEFSVTLPLLAEFTFKGNATTYALLSAGLGFGSVFGAIRTANYTKQRMSVLSKTAFWFGVSMIVFAITPSITTALIMVALVGFFSISFLSLANVILQMESRPEMRGRVMSLWAMAYLGSTPIGGPTIGWIIEHSNPRLGLATGGVAAIIAAGIGWLAVKKIRAERKS